MGRMDVKSITKNPSQSNMFVHYLLKDIDMLEQMIKDGVLNEDIQRIGAEQEVCFIDAFYRPAPIIMKVLKMAKDPHFTVEHASFNGEINMDPLELEDGCFFELEKQIQALTDKLNDHANKLNAQVVLTGILPTIRRSDLSIKNLTPLPRYKALNKVFQKLRGEPYEFRIEGMDQLITRNDTSMFESCNTSFQVHLQIKEKEFVNLYNWAQLISGPVLSCATNSPVLLGKRLWRETRIALFQQAIDFRSTKNLSTERVPRVTFGSRWLDKSVVEIFQEDIARHRAILGVDFDPTKEKDNEIPKLKALSVHNGTVYRWNRPCYGITNNQPHLRIENRYLPSGPTIVDEVANSAFWVGLMKGMPAKYSNVNELIDFEEVRLNFLKAARMGLGAQFKWINGKRIPAKQLILGELLPLAREGLKQVGIARGEIDKYLNIIEERVMAEKTGSQWIMDSVAKSKKGSTLEDALLLTTAGIVHRQQSNRPIHKWSEIDLKQYNNWRIRYNTIEQIMSTDLFSVHGEDPLEYVSSIMDWRHIHHVLVINQEGSLIGLITSGILLHHFGEKIKNNDGSTLVKDVMIKKPITVYPYTPIKDAVEIMKKENIGCLPVVRDKEVVGIVSEKDMNKVLAHLFEELNKE